MSSRVAALASALSFGLAIVASAPVANAGTCQRPTDPGGYNGYSYGADPVSSFDGTNVRIWYTTTGPNAVNPATSQADMTPDNVVTAATVADAALASYAQMGFLAPISDQGSAGSCGGDGRLDIYLMHFNAADGDTATESCVATGNAQQCTSFGLVEARLETIYGSFELGAHVVIAHELFHSVQNAYDAGLDRFWAEGTAQWAAKTIYPAEMDFESFLPSFFSAAGQSIDISGGGVVADYLYGSAIWPEFLAEHIGVPAIRGALQQEAMLGPPSMAAIGAALPVVGSSLGDAYPTFVAWNAATGSRAGTGGYANAASYPKVTLTTFPAADSVSAIGTGYGSFFYAFDFGTETKTLSLQADATRLSARTFPLVAGKANLGELATLPATVTGSGVVVVVGISAKKSDAPFTLTASAPSLADAGASTGTSTGGSDAGGDDAGIGAGGGSIGIGTQPPPESKGCGCGVAESGGLSAGLSSFALFAALAAARRRQSSSKASSKPSAV